MCFLYFILISYLPVVFFFFFNDTATTEIYTLSLHDALPICLGLSFDALVLHPQLNDVADLAGAFPDTKIELRDRKSTRLNSSHLVISYAVFCLKKKKKTHTTARHRSYRNRLLMMTLHVHVGI